MSVTAAGAVAESDPTGRLEVDRSSLASTLAERWADLAPVTGARGRILPDAPDVVELSGHVEVEAEPELLVQASQQVEREVAAAFPDGTVRVRFLLGGPARQPRTRRTTAIAVQEWSGRGMTWGPWGFWGRSGLGGPGPPSPFSAGGVDGRQADWAS